MPRKSSIHFKPVSNVRFSVSHSERTDLSEPAYLLPKEHQLGNVVVAGSLSENDLAARFIQQKEGMSRQAKTAGSSPFWEGVLVLPNTNSQEQSANLQAWKVAYEQATGHKVLHMSVHLDEGYMGTDGKPQYNPHSHVIVSRMDSKNRVIHLGRKQLAQVQDLTAEHLKMKRGSTLDEREGHRGRKHIPHREFRQQADEKRLELDTHKNLTQHYRGLFQADTPLINKLKSERLATESEVSKKAARIARLTELKEGYKLDRAKLKATGEAKQKDYQALKVAHEKALADLATAQAKADQVPELEAKISQQTTVIGNLLVNEDVVHKSHVSQAQEIAQLKAEIDRLNEQYRLDREAMKASGEAKQADYKNLKKDLAEALADLTTAQAEAKKVPELVATVSSQAAEIARLKAEYSAERESLKASGTAKQADYQALKKDHEAALAALVEAHVEKVSGLELSLKSTQEKVEKMDEYTKTLQAQLAEADKKIALGLIAKAEAIEASVQAGIKSESLLVTSNGHRAAAEKLTSTVADLTQTAVQRLQQINKLGQAVAGATEKWTAADYALTEALNDAAIQATEAHQLAEKLGTLTKENDRLTGENAELAAKWAAKANAYQVEKGKGTPAHLIDTTAIEVTPAKTAQEPQKQPEAPTDLVEQLRVSQVQGATAQAQAAKVPDLVEQATQQAYRAYQALKIVHEDSLAELKKTNQKAEKMEKQITQLTDENTKLAADKAKFAAMAESYQEEKTVIGPNERARLRALEATKTTPEAPKQVQGVIPSPAPTKSPREAFVALYDGIKQVLVGLIDGMRLDAADGRLGLFSAHSRTGPRVQVLCEVPRDKVMPEIGEVFNSRAVPGQTKNGIGG